MKDIIILDNNPEAYAFQPDNAIPIISWYGHTEDSFPGAQNGNLLCLANTSIEYADRELFKLIPLLSRLSEVDDVRDYIPHIVQDETVQYYKAYKILKQLQNYVRPSPFKDIMNGLKSLKTEAVAFFSKRKSQDKGSKSNKLVRTLGVNQKYSSVSRHTTAANTPNFDIKDSSFGRAVKSVVR